MLFHKPIATRPTSLRTVTSRAACAGDRGCGPGPCRTSPSRSRAGEPAPRSSLYRATSSARMSSERRATASANSISAAPHTRCAKPFPDVPDPPTDDSHLGWANYETWAVHLWLSNEEATWELCRDMARDALRSVSNVFLPTPHYFSAWWPWVRSLTQGRAGCPRVLAGDHPRGPRPRSGVIRTPAGPARHRAHAVTHGAAVAARHRKAGGRGVRPGRRPFYAMVSRASTGPGRAWPCTRCLGNGMGRSLRRHTSIGQAWPGASR